MKLVKKSLGIMLIAAVALSAFQGCKKGENDPALSLKSRKSRLAGEWKLTKADITKTNTDASGTDTEVEAFDGTNWSTNGVKSTETYSERITFEKDGTFKREIVKGSNAETMTGNWYFAGKNKEADLKKKEAVILSILTTTDKNGTSTYTGVDADEIFILDQLKGKEMVVAVDNTWSSAPAVGGAATATSGTEKGTKTFEQ